MKVLGSHGRLIYSICSTQPEFLFLVFLGTFSESIQCQFQPDFFFDGGTTWSMLEMRDIFRTLPNDEATPVKSVKVAASSGKGGFCSSVYGDSR